MNRQPQATGSRRGGKPYLLKSAILVFGMLFAASVFQVVEAIQLKDRL